MKGSLGFRPARCCAIVAALTVSLALTACSTRAPGPTRPSGGAGSPEVSKEATTAPATEVRIRVRNVGTKALDRVVFKFPSDTVQAGDLVPGESSDFFVVETAYRYAYVSALVDGKKRELQPIDYVGEEPLEPGSYTYDLKAVTREGAKRLEIKLVVAP